jgi:hypothetical protein
MMYVKGSSWLTCDEMGLFGDEKAAKIPMSAGSSMYPGGIELTN